MAVLISSVLLILLFPVYVDVYLYADRRDAKLGFALYLYDCVRILGGYARPYPAGVAFHLSEKRAFLLPYREMLSARKNFEITKGFSVCRYRQVIELGGAENAAGALMAGALLGKTADVLFADVRRRSDAVLASDILVNMGRQGGRVAVNVTVVFDLLIVLIAVGKLILEKVLCYGRKGKRSR